MPITIAMVALLFVPHVYKLSLYHLLDYIVHHYKQHTNSLALEAFCALEFVLPFFAVPTCLSFLGMCHGIDQCHLVTLFLIGTSSLSRLLCLTHALNQFPQGAHTTGWPSKRRVLIKPTKVSQSHLRFLILQWSRCTPLYSISSTYCPTCPCHLLGPT